MSLLPVILSILVSAQISPAEPVRIEGLQGLGNTQHHVVESELLGRSYDVLVGLPDGYDEADDTSYPTVYILDGGELYPMLRAYYRYLRIGGEAPEMILVAISYGTSDFENGNDRGHDYTAPSDESEHYGGAQDFQTFLSDELIPFIEASYRSSPKRRVLFGHSLGGQFVLYSAQTQPSFFWGHIASNPALHRNLELFLTMTPEIPTDGAQSYLFVGAASHDDPRFLEPRSTWVEYWMAQAQRPWHLRVETLDGHTHMSAPPASFRRGIRWLFSNP